MMAWHNWMSGFSRQWSLLAVEMKAEIIENLGINKSIGQNHTPYRQPRAGANHQEFVAPVE